MLQFAMAFMLTLSSVNPDVSGVGQDVPAGSQRVAELKVSERYRFNLGGESGSYTDWERYDLPRFDGLYAKIQFEKIYGKTKDKWASIARINLLGAGESKDQKKLSILLEVNRKDHKPTAMIKRTKGADSETFDVDLAADQPIEISVTALTPDNLLLTFNGRQYEIAHDFEIHGISVIASGADVKFEPFNLMRQANP